MPEHPVILSDERPALDETVALYESVCWSAYASDPASLAAATRGSALLLTDDEPARRAFYESRGLVEAHDVRPHPLRAFVRLAQ